MSCFPTLRRMLAGGLAVLALGLTAACGDDDPAGPANDTIIFRWTFGDDLEGWTGGTTPSANSWGDVALANADALPDAPDEDDGSVKLDGTGDPGLPNAWIYHTDLALPADAATLAYYAAGHDRDGGNSNLRVVLLDEGGTNHTLADWEEFTGSEGDHHWEERVVSIAAYAGQTVTLFFEQDDNGPGSHEQIYLDEIRVLRD